ncbi:MAG: leucine-rich repeat protein [Clostridia bacterium]|nr:leucine-rich repeat protein [Clostridia bacterium]
MIKRTKRVISVFLCALLLLSCAVSGFAADASGNCGMNITWEYDAATATLTINGSGDMYDFYSEVPWNNYQGSIQTVSFVGTENGIRSIGYGAFKDCTALQNCSIPDTVESLGIDCFNGCSQMQSIEIPGSVDLIPNSAFSNCYALQSVTIREGVTEIDKCAFEGCTNLHSIVVPDGLTTIGSMAFSAAGLTEVYLSDSVSEIGTFAFSCCRELQKVRMPQNESLTTIDNYAFERCEALTEITIPDSVTTIGRGAFDNCKSLPAINIPDSVTTIGEGAFDGCESIESFAIPASVTEIGDGAFSSCPSVMSLSVDENNPVYHSAENCIIDTAGKTLMFGCNASVIPDDGSVTAIADQAFMNCVGLESVTIPESVTSIGAMAFGMCSSLKSVTIPANVTELGMGAFTYCFSLENVVFETDHLTAIGDSTFSYCVCLKSIVLPVGIRQIGSQAFAYCANLKSVTLPQSLAQNVSTENTIGSSAFSISFPSDILAYLRAAYSELVAAGIEDMDGIPISVIKTIIDVENPQISDVYFAGGAAEWLTVLAKTGSGNNTLTAAQIHYEFNPLTAVEYGTARFDLENGLIYGLQTSLTDPSEYFHAKDGYTCTVTPSAQRDGQAIYGTGSTVYVYDENGWLVSQCAIMIIGDVDGDGLYGAMDAYLANLLRCGAFPYEKASRAQMFATDVNGDGQCDDTDVATLRLAGLLLAEIEQSGPTAVSGTGGEGGLDSVSIEYLGLIDQTLEMAEPQPEPADEAPEGTLTVSQIIRQILTFILRFFQIAF